MAEQRQPQSTREEREAALRRSVAGEPGDPTTGAPTPERSPPCQEPRGVQKGIADADKAARTGSKDESVRNTPPAGAWNDTSGD
jgi:hypothetical protein